jgi:hypothetical protein
VQHAGEGTASSRDMPGPCGLRARTASVLSRPADASWPRRLR